MVFLLSPAAAENDDKVPPPPLVTLSMLLPPAPNTVRQGLFVNNDDDADEDDDEEAGGLRWFSLSSLPPSPVLRVMTRCALCNRLSLMIPGPGAELGPEPELETGLGTESLVALLSLLEAAGLLLLLLLLWLWLWLSRARLGLLNEDGCDDDDEVGDDDEG